MRDLSVMEIEMVSGAGWWGDLWGGMSESIGNFFSGLGQSLAEAFHSWASSTPTPSPAQQQLIIACIQAGRNVQASQTQGGFSITFGSQGGGAVSGGIQTTGGSYTYICNGAAIP